MAGPGGTRQVRVELTIDPSRPSLSQVGERREAVIDLLVLAGDARQHVIGRLSQQMTVSLDEARHRHATASGVPYVTMLPVTGVPADVKAVEYDYVADVVGTATVRVR